MKRKLKKLEDKKSYSHNMILYRVISKNGGGYRREIDKSKNLDRLLSQVICIDYVNYVNRRPLPKHSGIDMRLLNKDWLFAFTSLKDLNSWFNYIERRAGSRLGGKIQILKVDKDCVIKGVKQAVFLLKSAIEIEQVKLNHFDL